VDAISSTHIGITVFSTVHLRNSKDTIFEGLMLIKNSSKVVAVQLSLMADGHAAFGDDALVTLT